jgi:trk system potassium uptake protein TrkH
MWLFSILVVLRAAYGYLPSHFTYELVFDSIALYLVWPLIRKVEIGQAIQAWIYLRYRKNFRKKVQFVTAVVLDGLRVMALFYLSSWLFRWTRFDFINGASSVTPRDLNFIDTFFLCFFLSQAATSHRWSWWISKIPLSHGRQVIFHYVAAVLIGTLLLLSPFSIKLGQSLPVIDGFFLTVSALSVTGLSTVDISQVLTLWGQFVLLLLIQLGGLGVVMVTAALSFAANNRLSLSSMLLGQTAFGTQHAGDMPKFLSKVFSITLVFEAFGALVLYYSLPEELPNRFFNAVFHSVSAFCNAGFSLFPNNLHQPPMFTSGIFMICVLIILGGLGFPIMFDIQKQFEQRKIIWERFSPHTRLTLSMTLILLILGAILFFTFESANLNFRLTFWDRIGQALFYTVSSRTAGFNMLPVENFHTSAQFFLILLMIIGANPASTGGGVKTTTVGVLGVTVLSTLGGKEQSVIFGRSISYEIVKRALTIIILYLLIAGLAITIMSLTEQITSIELVFEVISALSTVGLSLGVTSKLSFLGKIILMLLMLFGRIGIITAVLAGVGQRQVSHVSYPEDEFFVG